MHATKYKNIYLICIFLIRFIYSVHIIQVFYNINTQRRRLCPLFYKSVIRNLAADTKRLLSVLYSITAKNIHKLQCYLILALIPTFNSSSFNSLIELRAASILIFTGTLIPPPTRHLPFGSSKGLPITPLQTWSLLGLKKSLGHAQIGLLLGV